jgi:hypothetical protein
MGITKKQRVEEYCLGSGENPQKSAVHPYPRLTRGLRYR